MENLPDHYAVLRVDASATQQQIARAYRALMRTHHPDVDGGVDAGETADRELQNTELLRIMQAFAVLREPVRRAAYDRSLAGRARPGDGPTEHPGPEDSHASRTIRQHHQDHAGALGKRAVGVSRRNVKEVRKP